MAEFVVLAVVVTVTPGPGTANIVRVAARDGRSSAMGAVVGNSVGVLSWGVLSALGVSSLILASEIAHDLLRVGGAVALVGLGLRALLGRGDAGSGELEPVQAPEPKSAWRSGLVTSLANPKLAVFFVALFPQFLTPHAPVLPYALAMALAVVTLDVVWFSSVAWAVDRARTLLRRGVRRNMERFAGAVMVGLGIKLATESR